VNWILAGPDPKEKDGADVLCDNTWAPSSDLVAFDGALTEEVAEKAAVDGDVIGRELLLCKEPTDVEERRCAALIVSLFDLKLLPCLFARPAPVALSRPAFPRVVRFHFSLRAVVPTARRPSTMLRLGIARRSALFSGRTGAATATAASVLRLPAVLHGRALLGAAAPLASSASVSSLKRLRQLEDAANRAPADSARQQALMTACNDHGQARVAIRRYESGAYAEDEAVYREYVRALALTNQLGRLPMAQLGFIPRDPSYGGASPYSAYATSSQTHSTLSAPLSMGGGGGSGPGAPAGTPAGTPEAPIHVQYTESTRVQMLRLLQRLALVGLVAAGVMMFLDEKGMPKGLGLANEVQPVRVLLLRFAFSAAMHGWRA
jgi:hypothetical protein